MRMKAIFLALLMLLCGSAACAEGSGNLSGADLSYGRIVEMASYMQELATGDYLDIKQLPEAQQTIAQSWAAGISGAPRLVVQLDINDMAYIVDTRARFSQEPEIVSFEAQSSAIYEVWQTLAYYAGEQAGLSEADYSQIMTINGALNATMMYAEEGVEGNAMYIALYEDAAPVMLIVCAENGAVYINGMFLPDARLSRCQNHGQVSLWLMINGLAMTCREISPE